MLTGLFGGVTWSPQRRVTLLAEYDAKSFNAGVRLQPARFLQLQWAWWQLRVVTATLALSVQLQ